MTRDSLAAALAAAPDHRCADDCDATRALFPAAIEGEVAGHPPHAALYARLERCRACAAEYIAALDLAFALDEDGVDATETPALHFYPPDGDRRVAEDPAEYGEGDA